MAAGKSTYLRQALINESLRGIAFAAPAAIWLALHTQDPTEAGTAGELVAGGYARQAITFGAPTVDGLVASDAEILFDAATAPWLVSHFSLWDDATAGNCLHQGPLSVTLAVATGDRAKLAVGGLTIQEK